MKRRSPEGKCPRESKEPRVFNETQLPLIFDRNPEFQNAEVFLDDEMEEARSAADSDALSTVSSDLKAIIEHLSDDSYDAYDNLKNHTNVGLTDIPLLALAQVASNLPYDDLRNFQLVSRQFYFAERAHRNSHTKFSIEFVKHLFPKYVHYHGNTMFSMGRALIATLRYLGQSAKNIYEIELDGLHMFSSTHFNDVVEKSRIPATDLFKNVRIISSSRCALSFADLSWFAKYSPNITHIKVLEEPLLCELEENEVGKHELKKELSRILKQKQSLSAKWSSNRRKVVLELKKIFNRLSHIELY